MARKRNRRKAGQPRRGGYSQKYVGYKYGFRSGLEESVGKQLKDAKVDYEYEKESVTYTVPARKAKYTPDFFLPNGIIVETKGRFTSSDRKKHQLIKKQCPELDIRFVFSNPNTKIRKGSKTSYGDWCEKNGFLYAKEEIPQDWINEKGTR